MSYDPCYALLSVAPCLENMVALWSRYGRVIRLTHHGSASTHNLATCYGMEAFFVHLNQLYSLRLHVNQIYLLEHFRFAALILKKIKLITPNKIVGFTEDVVTIIFP